MVQAPLAAASRSLHDRPGSPRQRHGRTKFHSLRSDFVFASSSTPHHSTPDLLLNSPPPTTVTNLTLHPHKQTTCPASCAQCAQSGARYRLAASPPPRHGSPPPSTPRRPLPACQPTNKPNSSACNAKPKPGSPATQPSLNLPPHHCRRAATPPRPPPPLPPNPPPSTRLHHPPGHKNKRWRQGPARPHSAAG